MSENKPDKLDLLLDATEKLHARLDKDGQERAEMKTALDTITKRMDAVEGLGARVDSVEGRIGAARNDSHEGERQQERRAFTDAQMKAERVAQAFGDSAGAPAWMHGETVPDYQRRLMSPFKKHSVSWKDIDLNKIHESALGVAETQIYADAFAAANSPAGVAEGTLREVVTRDDSGRAIRRFIGDPEACWAPFKQPVRFVRAFHRKVA